MADTSIAEPKQIPAATLVLYGVTAGIYLIYTIAWAVYAFTAGQLVDAGIALAFTQQLSLALAVLAPMLWLLATIKITQNQQNWQRAILLFAGACFLVPWPVIWGVA